VELFVFEGDPGGWIDDGVAARKKRVDVLSVWRRRRWRRCSVTTTGVVRTERGDGGTSLGGVVAFWAMAAFWAAVLVRHKRWRRLLVSCWYVPAGGSGGATGGPAMAWSTPEVPHWCARVSALVGERQPLCSTRTYIQALLAINHKHAEKHVE
jgi:hypothetical protein